MGVGADKLVFVTGGHCAFFMALVFFVALSVQSVVVASEDAACNAWCYGSGYPYYSCTDNDPNYSNSGYVWSPQGVYCGDGTLCWCGDTSSNSDDFPSSSCVDTDGAVNPEDRGTCTDDSGSYADSCPTNDALTEWYCYEGSCHSIVLSCDGYCSSGECIVGGSGSNTKTGFWCYKNDEDAYCTKAYVDSYGNPTTCVSGYEYICPSGRICNQQGSASNPCIYEGSDDDECTFKIYVEDEDGDDLTAYIYIDDVYEAHSDSLEVDVKKGSYTIEALRSGYGSDSETVRCSGGETERVYLTLEKDGGRSEDCEVEVSTEKDEYCDGPPGEMGSEFDMKLTFRCDGDRTNPDSGTLEVINLAHYIYDNVNEVWYLEEDQDMTLRFTRTSTGIYEAASGQYNGAGTRTFAISAEIYGELVEEEYSVEVLEYGECDDDNNNDDECTFKIYVEDENGDELSAKIYVDGDYKDTDESLEIDVDEGSHTIKATKTDYDSDSETVECEDGDTERITLTLRDEDDDTEDCSDTDCDSRIDDYPCMCGNAKIEEDDDLDYCCAAENEAFEDKDECREVCEGNGDLDFTLTCPSECEEGGSCTCTVRDCSSGIIFKTNTEGTPLEPIGTCLNRYIDCLLDGGRNCGDVEDCFASLPAEISSSPQRHTFQINPDMDEDGVITVSASCLEEGNMGNVKETIDVDR